MGVGWAGSAAGGVEAGWAMKRVGRKFAEVGRVQVEKEEEQQKVQRYARGRLAFKKVLVVLSCADFFGVV